MRRSGRTIDDYTLAGYLAGELTPGRRRQVAQLLAENEEARELVLAARQLLDEDGLGIPSRRAELPFQRLRLAVWLAGISVLVVVVVAAVTLLGAKFRPKPVTQGSPFPSLEDASWNVDLVVSDGYLDWHSLPDVTYQVVFWDLEGGRVTYRVPVTSTEFDLGAVSSEEVAGPHSIWVEAVGPDGQTIKRTRSMPFTYAEGRVGRPDR